MEEIKTRKLNEHIEGELFDKEKRVIPSVAFEYNTESNVLNFNSKDFYFVTNMFGLSTFDMANICKEYAYTKLNNPNILTSVFYNSRKNK